MLFIVSLTPFFILFLLMVVFNRPAHFAAPITAAVTAFLAWKVWLMEPSFIVGAFERGLLVALEIILIIFGALLLISVLREAGSFNPIRKFLVSLSSDKRIQAVVVGWFFVGFVEGVAGFGTPALLAIPILIAIGFAPFPAVILSLIGNSAMVVFGAAGLPIIVGVTQGVGLPGEEAVLLAGETARVAALLNLLLSPIIPLFLAMFAARFSGGTFRSGLRIWPFAVFTGLAFMIPSFAAAYWIGPRVPTIIGSLVGGAVTTFALRRGWFTKRESEKRSTPGLLKAIFPYGLAVVMLFLTSYSPGIIFLFSALFAIFLYRLKLNKTLSLGVEALHRMVLPFVGLFFVLGVVQIFLLSGNNLSGLPSMPLFVAEQLASVGEFWPFVAPIVGAMGAFMSGSSTVSNLLFSSLQHTTASVAGLSVVLILALQATGSAAGNMIAVHNILAAEAVAGVHSREGEILRFVFIPALIYLLALGVIGLFLSLSTTPLSH